MAEKTYDAASETAKLVPTTVTIEGKEFTVKRTGRALRRLMEIDPGNRETTPDEGVDILYSGVSIMLVDPARDPEISAADEHGVWHPTTDWLEGNLDFKVAQDLMERFVPASDPIPADVSPMG